MSEIIVERWKTFDFDIFLFSRFEKSHGGKKQNSSSFKNPFARRAVFNLSRHLRRYYDFLLFCCCFFFFLKFRFFFCSEIICLCSSTVCLISFVLFFKEIFIMKYCRNRIAVISFKLRLERRHESYKVRSARGNDVSVSFVKRKLWELLSTRLRT